MNKNKIMDMLNNNDVLYVKDLLPYLRGTKSTYYNLEKSSVEAFKEIYAKCKKIQNRKVDQYYCKHIENILNNDKLVLDIIYKTEIIKILLTMTDFEKYALLS